MPGVVAELRVREGDVVELGQVVLVLELMKLFMLVAAEIDGIDNLICLECGVMVTAGRRLVTIEVVNI